MKALLNIFILSFFSLAANSQTKKDDCLQVLKKLKDAYNTKQFYAIRGTLTAYSDPAKKKVIDTQNYYFSKGAQGFQYRMGPVESIADGKNVVYIDHQNKQVYYSQVNNLNVFLGEAENNFNYLLKNIEVATKVGYSFSCSSFKDGKSRFSINSTKGNAMESVLFYYDNVSFRVNKIELNGKDPVSGTDYWMDFQFNFQTLTGEQKNPTIAVPASVVKLTGQKYILTEKFRQYELIIKGN